MLLQPSAALEAVEAAVVALEDSPNFNAGYGGSAQCRWRHELDTSIMRGADLAAGAVTLVRRIRNRSRAARCRFDPADQ